MPVSVRSLLPLLTLATACAAAPTNLDNDEVADSAFELVDACFSPGMEAAPVTDESPMALETDVPSEAFFVRWTNLPNDVSSDIDPESLPRLSVSCPDDTLYPTHPSQATKLYHRARVGRYKTRASEFMHADDEACATGQDRDYGRGFPICLEPDHFYSRLASDTFMDGCGNFYRGFWQQRYFRRHDNVATLLSRGRTVFERPDTQFPGRDFIASFTYPLRPSEFVQLSPLFDGDFDKIVSEQENAASNGHGYDADTCRYDSTH